MLEELKIQAQSKGFRIEHKELENTSIFAIRTKDERLLFHRCEVGNAEKRIRLHREAALKLQELLN